MNGEQGSVMQLSKANMSSQILKQQVKSLQDLHQILWSFQLKIFGTPECKKDWVSVSCACSWDMKKNWAEQREQNYTQDILYEKEIHFQIKNNSFYFKNYNMIK